MSARPHDRRSADEILAHARWDSYAQAIPLQDMLARGTLTATHLRAADRFFVWLEAQRRTVLDIAAVEAYAKESASPTPLRTLRDALARLASGDPALRVFEEAIRRRERARPPRRESPGKPRTLSVSVAEEALPQPFRATLAAMRDELPGAAATGGVRAPAPSIIVKIATTLRQLAWSAREAGVAVALDDIALRAYLRDLKARKLRPASIRAALGALESFARYAGEPADIVETLKRLRKRWEKREAETMKLKEHKLQWLPHIGAIKQRAEALFSSAQDAGDIRSAQHHRNAAAALAIFLLAPLRAADTLLVFGETLLWTGTRYRIDVVLSKSGTAQRRFRATLDPWLTPFIDALVLQGCAPAHLDALREDCLARRRPLFVDTNGKAATYGFVSRCWKRHIGAGAHIARSLIHDALGALGALGVRMAMTMCGQISAGIEKEYQTRALETIAVKEVQQAWLDSIDDDAFEGFD